MESADGGHLHVKGRGSVRVKLNDERVVKLTGVRYIPEIKKNLASIGQLEQKGCNLSTSGGVTRV